MLVAADTEYALQRIAEEASSHVHGSGFVKGSPQVLKCNRPGIQQTGEYQLMSRKQGTFTEIYNY